MNIEENSSKISDTISEINRLDSYEDKMVAIECSKIVLLDLLLSELNSIGDVLGDMNFKSDI